MAERNTYHVTPSADGGWLARMNDEGEAHPFRTREAALADAQQSARRDGHGEIIIHRPDGSIEERLRVGASAERSSAEMMSAVPSKAAIRGHPLHPMLVPFPIAFLIALPVVDIVYGITGRVFWAEAAFIVLCAGLIGGALAALVGLVDFAGVRAIRNRRVAWWHVLANAGALTLALVNLLARIGDQAGAVLPAGVMLSVVTAGLLVVSAWFGGELSYRHRIGVMAWKGASSR